MMSMALCFYDSVPTEEMLAQSRYPRSLPCRVLPIELEWSFVLCVGLGERKRGLARFQPSPPSQAK